MGIRTQIKNEFLIVLLVLGSMVSSTAAPCPSHIYPSFCEELQALGDGDWTFCRITMSGWRDAFGGPVCNKVDDSTCLNRPPDTTRYVLPDSVIADTRALFETYDLRWPDNIETRASMPTADGPRDSVSYRFHIPDIQYVVYATKQTILALGAESYILEVLNWEVPKPLSLSRSTPSLSVQPSAQIFNLKGQRIEAVKGPEVKVRGKTIRH